MPNEETPLEYVLEPCRRPGGPDDWWDEQHKMCTGLQHRVGEARILCSCPCHNQPPTTAFRQEPSE